MGAAVIMAWGLGATPANSTTLVTHEWINVATGNCLDFRSDYGPGPYATDCNRGVYQAWAFSLDVRPTAMRQGGTGLCLVARNGQAVMKGCLADDPAALWHLNSTAAGFQLVNNVTRTCLGEGSGSIHFVRLVSCTGGNSQQWVHDGRP